MPKYALSCIGCGQELVNAFDDATNQPYNGTTFTSHGHYGSTAFDDFEGYFLEINVCDACLILHKDRVMQGRDRRPIKEDGVIIGYDEAYERLVPWHPDRKGIEWVLKQTLKERDLIPIDELTEEEAKDG